MNGINIQIFIRNVQLAKLGIAELEGFEKKTYEFLIENLSNLNTYICKRYPNNLYFGKSPNEIVLDYDSEYGYIWADEEEIWLFFKLDINMSYYDFSTLIKWWVERIFNIKPIRVLYQNMCIPYDLDLITPRTRIIENA